MSADTFGFGLLTVTFLILVAVIWGVFWAFMKIWPIASSIAVSAGIGIRQNPYIIRVLARFPRFFAFVSKRLARDRFSGLPLTVLGGLFVYFLWLYLGLTLDFILVDPTIGVDPRVANLFFAYRDPVLVQFFTVITSFGASQIVAVGAVGASVILILNRQTYFLYGLWISLSGSVASVTLLKILFGRPRSDLGVYIEASNSFPSGHANISVAFYGFLAYVVFRHTRHRLRVVVLAVVLAFLIGFSRIYLVEHYLTDVLNGYLIGSIWLVFSVMVVEWLQDRHFPHPLKSTASRRLLIASVCGLTIGGMAFLTATYNPPLRGHAAAQIMVLDTSIEEAFSTGQLSPFTETVLGGRQEPTSLIVLAKDDAEFVALFRKSGWTLADKVGFSSFSEAIYAAWFGGEYISAPVTPSFWMQTPNAFGFQKATTANTLRERHHVRFWKSGFQTADGLMIYVGTASFDDGLKWGITHHIDPNIDKERDILLKDLANSGMLESQTPFQLIPAILGENFAGDPFFTDGKAVIIRVQ